jgi:AraC-like DNA-binding protein
LLLRAIAQAEGPDAPYRIISGRSAFEIGLIGTEALCARTLREAFHRVSRAMPLHCTHEVFIAKDGPEALHIGDGWAVTLGDDEMLHLVQQFFVAMIDMICSLAAGPPPCVSRVGMLAHPDVGLTHLQPWLGSRVYQNGQRMLDLEILDELADLPIPKQVRDEATLILEDQWPPLSRGKTLSEDVALLVGTMLPRTKPTIDRIALAAGLSRRTLQRRLSSEGLSLAGIVESTRARIALSRLRDSERPALNQLAEELGYSDQATLTRAVQRWTGKAPSDVH